eukprot:TRINITY_DN24999_c0_g1_i1.p1 TRINITY_DN24999_c0_g1~~TRINITY_DN24999_c0_g1_i1.p1  ORF type:complete len:250 (-),score=47.39 TRINITY_DN24999_c0_g1_i1:331-1080(-)
MCIRDSINAEYGVQRGVSMKVVWVLSVLLLGTHLCHGGGDQCDDAWFSTDANWMSNSSLHWDTRKNATGIVIQTRGSLLTDWLLFKQTTTFAASSLPGLVDLLYTRNVERNGEWSKSFMGGRYAKRFNASDDVLYMQYNGGAGVWPRDFCYARCMRTLPRGGMDIVFRSIDDPVLCPVNQSFVRGVMMDCAERIWVGENGSIVLTYILQSNTEGDLPKAVSNLANINVMFKEFSNIHSLVQNPHRPYHD